MSNQVFRKGMLTVGNQKGPFFISPFCRSSSSSLNAFPWKSSTRHSGVTRRRYWSREKCRVPWKSHNISLCPCVRTKTSFRRTRKEKWLGILAPSVGPFSKNLPGSFAPYAFFMQKVFLDGTFCRVLLVTVWSPLVSDVYSLLALLWSLFESVRFSFSSVIIKTYIVLKTWQLLNHFEIE